MTRPPRPVFALDDIPDGDSVAIKTRIGRKTAHLIAVRRGDTVHLYVNSCPHIGSPLDFTPGRFLTPDKRMILCATHGALFEINTGLCVYGPCAGRSLTAVAAEVRGGQVWLAATPG